MHYISRDQRFAVSFKALPALVPQLLDTKFPSWFDRWRGAASRRTFVLSKAWRLKLTVDPAEFDDLDLSGTFIIPPTYAGKTILLDGASVPWPWLVSFLSFGLLRPVGVMLTASIVHDFAFQHGLLLRERDGGGKPEEVEMARHHADRLFGRMIATVNKMPVVGFLGWLAVRLGWLFVRYGKDQGRWQRPVPWSAFALLAVLLAALLAAMAALGPWLLISLVSGGYFLAYVLLALVGPPTSTDSSVAARNVR